MLRQKNASNVTRAENGTSISPILQRCNDNTVKLAKQTRVGKYGRSYSNYNNNMAILLTLKDANKFVKYSSGRMESARQRKARVYDGRY